MTKIAYITDSHIGGDGKGWCQQPPCPELLPELFDALGQRLEKESVELLIHGGDCVDNGTPEQMSQAADVFSSLGIDFRLVMGNHDLARPDSFANWSQKFPFLFSGDLTTQWGDFAIDYDSYMVIGLQNVWKNNNSLLTHYWDSQNPESGFLRGQILWLTEIIKSNPLKNIILFLHDLLIPLPSGEVGLSDHIHASQMQSVVELLSVVRASDNIKLVLSGHCHATTANLQDGTTFITTAAFVEPPFQYRILEISENSLQIKMHDFNQLAGKSKFDDSMKWVLGDKKSQNLLLEQTVQLN